METKEKEGLFCVYPDGNFHKPDDCVWSSIHDKHILKSEARETVDDDWVHEDEQDWVLCDDVQLWAHVDDSWYCEFSNECYYEDTYRGRTVDDEYINEEFAGEYDYKFLGRGDNEGRWCHYDCCVYCEDIDEYVEENEAYWCDVAECYYWDEDNVKTVDDEHISQYANSPEPINLNCRSREAQFSVGFEIEKTVFKVDGGIQDDQGDYVGSLDIFKGYETDSSCGVEAITNILPLGSPRSNARSYVFDMIDDAHEVINSPYNTKCGGHINISVNGMTSYDLLDRVRGNMAIMYAMYRYRLRRSYVYQNKKMKRDDNTKYSPVHVKSGGVLEIRLPSAVANVKQLKHRYDFMYKILHHSVNTRRTYDQLLDDIDHILMRMYKRDRGKVDSIKDLSHYFRRYILNDENDSKIEYYLERQED
jgi:hypothetical protein